MTHRGHRHSLASSDTCRGLSVHVCDTYASSTSCHIGSVRWVVQSAAHRHWVLLPRLSEVSILKMLSRHTLTANKALLEVVNRSLSSPEPSDC